MANHDLIEMAVMVPESSPVDPSAVSVEDDDSSPICVICWDLMDEGQQTRILHCNHMHRFHIDCINKWTKKVPTCPVCRRKVCRRCCAYCSPNCYGVFFFFFFILLLVGFAMTYHFNP
jgi:hypothetical protein